MIKIGNQQIQWEIQFILFQLEICCQIMKRDLTAQEY